MKEHIKRAYDIGMYQIEEEITPFLEFYSSLKVKRFMEIGTERGGAFYLFCQYADDPEIAISLDIPSCATEGKIEARDALLKSFAKNVFPIGIDSHTPAAFQAVKDIVGDKPLDFLFIDGDHSYAGTRLDYEMYSPLVKDGGWIGFHDITEAHRGHLGCPQVFDEVSVGKIFKRFDTQSSWAGIGVIQK